jgi:hypothetical protein
MRCAEELDEHPAETVATDGGHGCPVTDRFPYVGGSERVGRAPEGRFLFQQGQVRTLAAKDIWGQPILVHPAWPVALRGQHARCRCGRTKNSAGIATTRSTPRAPALTARAGAESMATAPRADQVAMPGWRAGPRCPPSPLSALHHENG